MRWKWMGMTVPVTRGEELSTGPQTAVWEPGRDLPGCACCAREGEGREKLCLIREIYAHSMLEGNEGSAVEDCRPGCEVWEKENYLWGKEE